MRITGDRDASDSLSILTYQYAWQHAHEYDSRFEPANWLLKNARKLAVESERLKSEKSGKEAANENGGVKLNIAALDRQKSFIRAVDSLSLDCRDSLALALMRSYTYQSIAEIMGVRIDAAKMKVFDSKKELNEKLRRLGIKKHQVSKSNILRELIPLYINGVLSGKHKVAFEKSLKNDPNLKQEYMEFYEIEEYFDQLATASQQHLTQLYGSIKNSLEDFDDEVVEEQSGDQLTSPKIDFFHHLLSSSRIGWGLAILQFAILTVVLIFIVPQYSNPVSASISPGQLLQKNRGKQINVIFQDAATAKEIIKLLQSLDAEMQSGPTNIGLYTITVDVDENHVHEVLNKLRLSKIVLLADPAY
jgi:DNA-directed RNA polymerase specialized sigma24 family protein